MPFEHVLPREIILHINWLTVGACRETENRYSKFVPERREYREYDYGSGLCVSERGGKTFIFPAVVRMLYEFQTRQYPFVRRTSSEIIAACA